MTEPIISRRTYTFAFLGLLALTVVTTLVAYVDLGPFSSVVAIVIAGAKAAIIVAFFMEMIASPRIVQVFAVGAVIWFGILMSLTLTDYITRGWVPVPGR
jgi:cytochrome c oxidase subunit 4